MTFKKILIFAVLYALVLNIANIQAEPGEGILKEFRQTEEMIRNKTKSKDERKKTLEVNLESAMRLAIKRRFYHTQKEVLKDLNSKTLVYEKHPSTNLIWFARYKNYYVRFDFARNPEMFYQAPAMDKFLVRDTETGDHKNKPVDG